MSVQSEITRLENAKAAIKAAIEGKGVTVPDATMLDGMASLIESIEAGGGSGGPYADVTLLTTIETHEDVSAIQIDWQTEWSDYDAIVFRPNVITFSIADWMYMSVNTTSKKTYTDKLAIFGESYTFGVIFNPSLSFSTQVRLLFGQWYGSSLGVEADTISYIYIQPYVSTTLIKSGSKIDVLGVNFA